MSDVEQNQILDNNVVQEEAEEPTNGRRRQSEESHRVGNTIFVSLIFSFQKRRFTLNDKINFVRRLKTEFNNKINEAARKMGIAASVLRAWRKQEDQLLAQVKRREKSRLPGGGRNPLYPKL